MYMLFAVWGCWCGSIVYLGIILYYAMLCYADCNLYLCLTQLS